MKILWIFPLFYFFNVFSKEIGPQVHRANLNNISTKEHDPTFKIYHQQDLDLVDFNWLTKISGLKELSKTRGKKLQKKLARHHVLKKITSLNNNRQQKRLKSIYRKLQKTDTYLFKEKAHLFAPNTENSFTFINAAHEFSYNPWTKGVANLCSGLTSLHRYFTFLASYEPSAVRSDLSVIFKQIDLLLMGQPQKFLGFANLRELSSILEIEEYLKIKTLLFWAQNGLEVRDTGRASGLAARIGQSSSNVWKVVAAIEKRVNRFEYPTVYISQPELGSLITPNIHSVLVYKVQRNEDGSATLFYNDINFYAEEAQNIRLAIHVSPGGKVFYDSHVKQILQEDPTQLIFTADRAARIWIPNFNDEETALFFHALQ